jgi:hypothetical protein
MVLLSEDQNACLPHRLTVLVAGSLERDRQPEAATDCLPKLIAQPGYCRLGVTREIEKTAALTARKESVRMQYWTQFWTPSVPAIAALWFCTLLILLSAVLAWKAWR